jgi:hypothetical protein
MVTCGSKEPPPQLTRSAIRGTSPTSPTAFIRLPTDVAVEKTAYYDELWTASVVLS